MRRDEEGWEEGEEREGGRGEGRKIRQMLKISGDLESLMHTAVAQYLRENVRYEEV